MFRRKVEYEDERQPLPVIWTVVIAIVILAGMFIGAYTLTYQMEKRELERQYDCPIEEII